MHASAHAHAVVHETGIHGGMPPRVVGIAAAIAFVFGSTVLLAEAFDSDDPAHSAGMNAEPAAAGTDSYVPAAGRAWLTGSYDRAVALSMRESAWRPGLVAAVARDLPSSGSVVEVGCGTGSLTVALAAARPDATVIGVDGDPAVLAIARRKAGAERVTWIEGFAGSFLLPTASADVALCSLLLHHLSDDDKAAALEHIADILTGDGVLHVADWGPPRGPATALGARALKLLDGRAGPQRLLDGQLPGMLTAAGFTGARRQAALRTVWGTLELWRAQR